MFSENQNILMQKHLIRICQKYLPWQDMKPNQAYKPMWITEGKNHSMNKRCAEKSKRPSFLLVSFSGSCDSATWASQREWQQAHNGWDANLSWHAESWLRLLKLSTINVWDACCYGSLKLGLEVVIKEAHDLDRVYHAGCHSVGLQGSKFEHILLSKPMHEAQMWGGI